MCGRFALTASSDTIKQHFSVQQSFVLNPLYNIAPSNLLLAVTSNRELSFFEWGYLPSWGEKSKYDVKPQINARLETISYKPMFKQAFLWRRCLLVASGFYEWAEINGSKQPFYITLAEHQPVFAFAGIYDGDTCAIITHPASDSISRFHQRMPLILKPQFYHEWLNIGRPAKFLETEYAYYEQSFSVSPVSKAVNNPKFTGKECIISIS